MLPPEAFRKQDEGDDLTFYDTPRLVTHIDDAALAALTCHYARVIPADAVVLDLMSSWVSHLPHDLRVAEVIGHGMNAIELASNQQLDRWFIADLNTEPTLPLDDESIDAALCCAGVQYLQRPVEVFSEVARTLRPSGVFTVSFSNRCFPSKAVRVWQSLDMSGRAALVRLYMERSGFTGSHTAVLANGSAGDPMVTVTGKK